jgi:hypothetical protein
MPIDSHLSYLDKHALLPALVQARPDPALGLVVALHFCETPEWRATLDALAQCLPPPVAVEVLLGFHLPGHADAAARASHAQALADATHWTAAHTREGLCYHVLDLPDIAPKDFGEGLSRKLLLDEAVRRLAAVANPNAPIACLESGAIPANDYLQALVRHFHQHRRCTTATVSFTTPEAEAQAELALRYAMRGLRAMRHPHAFYHFGGLIAVRADAYQRESGMNRRKVGADFHFLHKLTPLGLHTECLTTTVQLPLLRTQAADPSTVFDPAAFQLLGTWTAHVLAHWQSPAADLVATSSALHPALAAWLAHSGFPDRLQGMQASATQAASFRQRFFRWFSVLEVQHFMHFAHPAYFERMPLALAAATWLPDLTDGSMPELLQAYRALDALPYSNSL